MLSEETRAELLKWLRGKRRKARADLRKVQDPSDEGAGALQAGRVESFDEVLAHVEALP